MFTYTGCNTGWRSRLACLGCAGVDLDENKKNSDYWVLGEVGGRYGAAVIREREKRMSKGE